MKNKTFCSQNKYKSRINFLKSYQSHSDEDCFKIKPFMKFVLNQRFIALLSLSIKFSIASFDSIELTFC